MARKSWSDEDHDNLTTILANMEYVKKSLDVGSTRMTGLAADIAALHKQIDDLNSWKNKVVGIAVGISSVFSLLVTFLFNKMQK